MSDDFQAVRFPIPRGPVPAPEGTGIDRRFIRPLQEPLHSGRTFRTAEEGCLALQQWLITNNDQWLVGRDMASALRPKCARHASNRDGSVNSIALIS